MFSSGVFSSFKSRAFSSGGLLALTAVVYSSYNSNKTYGDNKETSSLKELLLSTLREILFSTKNLIVASLKLASILEAILFRF